MNIHSFPNKLRWFRERAGYSQKDVSKFLELLNSANISRWEKGTVLPGLIYLYQLSMLYNVPIHDFYPEIWEFLKEDIDLKTQQSGNCEFLCQLEKSASK